MLAVCKDPRLQRSWGCARIRLSGVSDGGSIDRRDSGRVGTLPAGATFARAIFADYRGHVEESMTAGKWISPSILSRS